MIVIHIAALQHYAFCPRQCALIHNEQEWAENILTAQGKVLHRRIESRQPETRRNIRYERSVHVASEKLGITGIVDLIEKNLLTGQLQPIEYKRGKPKTEPWDEIQLCAQTLCLEEMTGQSIREGALWYGQIRQRITVSISNELRALTKKTINEVKKLLENGETPAPIYSKRCKSCSLIETCQPQLVQTDYSKQYIQILFEEEDDA